MAVNIFSREEKRSFITLVFSPFLLTEDALFLLGYP
jgi:hypothetical protein